LGACVAVAQRKALNAQADPSHTKPLQANPNKIAWFCLVLFVRIGTYQWLTGDSK
jgi:hypothetical protein